MEKLKHFKRDLPTLSAEEKRAVRRLLVTIEQLPDQKWKSSLRNKTVDLVHAGVRTERRYRSNQKTEQSRRVTVGARVRRCDAERYREAARSSGRSVYRFVVDALEAECSKQKTGE